MAARDKTYSTLNYEQRGGSVWHIGGTLELGDDLTLAAGATPTQAILTWNGGQLLLIGIPTADPHIVGALWNSAGVATISAG